MAKERMNFSVWQHGENWFWEVTNAYGRRLASQTDTAYAPRTETAARRDASNYIRNHNGTTNDYE